MALFKNKSSSASSVIKAEKPSPFSSGILKFFFGYRFVTLVGIIIGSIIYNIHSETNPLDLILTSVNLYVICLLIVLAEHFILWIFADKATFYNIIGRILSFISDYIFLVLAILCTVGSLFLLNAFVF